MALRTLAARLAAVRPRAWDCTARAGIATGAETLARSYQYRMHGASLRRECVRRAAPRGPRGHAHRLRCAFCHRFHLGPCHCSSLWRCGRTPGAGRCCSVRGGLCHRSLAQGCAVLTPPANVAVYEEMRVAKVPVTSDAYLSVLHVHVRLRDVERATKTHEAMMLDGIAPTTATYNLVLQAASHGGDLNATCACVGALGDPAVAHKRCNPGWRLWTKWSDGACRRTCVRTVR